MFGFFDPPPEAALFDSLLEESQRLLESEELSPRQVAIHLLHFAFAASLLTMTPEEFELAVKTVREHEMRDKHRGGPGDRMAKVFKKGWGGEP